MDQSTPEEHYLLVGVFQFSVTKWTEFQNSGLQSQEAEISVRDASGGVKEAKQNFCDI